MDTFGQRLKNSFMRNLKYVLIGIITLALSYLAVNLFAPNRIKFEESILIDAKADVVYGFCSDLQTWGRWNQSFIGAVGVENEFSDPSNGPEAIWTLVSAGEKIGRVRTVEYEENLRLKTSIDLGLDTNWLVIEWVFEESETGTKVTCIAEGQETAFGWRFINLGLETKLNGMYVGALEGLKQISQAQS